MRALIIALREMKVCKVGPYVSRPCCVEPKQLSSYLIKIVATIQQI